MTLSIGTSRIHDRGLDCRNLCEICGQSRTKGSHIECAKKRAAKYRKDSK